MLVSAKAKDGLNAIITPCKTISWEDIRAMKHVYSRHTVVLSSIMLFASVGRRYAKIAAV